jgi:hypothetical protein
MIMRCPNPACKKPINCSMKDIEKLEHCSTCGTRYATDFHILDFLDKKVNLFTIFGIFVAIVTILPTYIDGNGPIQNNTTHIFYQPPAIIMSTWLTILTNFFIIACSFIVLFLATAIVNELFGDNRYREIILSENRFFTFRKEDPARVIFAFPFIILNFTLIFSIIISSGDFWWAYLILFAVFEGIVVLLTHLAFNNPEKNISNEK